jgi:hypothetical protein
MGQLLGIQERLPRRFPEAIFARMATAMLFAAPSRGPVPFVLWVNPQPVPMKHCDWKCSMSFTITPESIWQRMHRKSGSYYVCPCMGHFIG